MWMEGTEGMGYWMNPFHLWNFTYTTEVMMGWRNN